MGCFHRLATLALFFTALVWSPAWCQYSGYYPSYYAPYYSSGGSGYRNDYGANGYYGYSRGGGAGMSTWGTGWPDCGCSARVSTVGEGDQEA